MCIMSCPTSSVAKCKMYLCRLFKKKAPPAHISRATSRLSLCACAVTSSINWEATDTISWNSCYVYVCSCVLNMFKTTEGATDCEMCFDISDALSQGRRRHVEPYCDRRWDMGAPYYTWIKTAVFALEAYRLAEKEKVQADDFNKEEHVYRSQSVLLVEFLPQGTTINSAVYCETLKKLRRAIQNKRREMLSATILLLHDNARPHSAAQTQDPITSFRWDQLDHTPYSPDLAPTDLTTTTTWKMQCRSG